MADIIMKIQDKMALIVLMLNVFGSLNMQIEAIFPSESACVFSFSFQQIVKKLLAKIV